MAKSLEFLLALDNTRFNRALDVSQAKIVAAGRKMAGGLDPVINKMKTLRTVTANVAAAGVGIGAGAAIAGLYSLNTVLRESVQLAGEQEAAEAKLEAVLRATGEAAGLSADDLKTYAGDLQSITTYGDEATIAAMAMLATFKGISGDNFKEATRLAQDMSAVMDQDLNSSIVQIGKALNDPVKGMSALSRVGVTFTESQKDQIKALQESGDLLGAQKIILEELESQFGGAAEAARDTFGGGVEGAGNALGDLKEEIGFAITNNQFFLEGIKLLEKQFVKWTKAIKDNGPEVREYAKQTALTLLVMGESGLTALDYIYRGSQGIAAVFQRTAAFALDVSGGIFNIIKAGAALTDFLGITTNATDEWAISAEAAFAAADDLKAKSSENFQQMGDGSTKIQAARDGLASFREEIEKIPSDAVDDIANGVDDAARSTGDAADATERYENKMVEVNGVWAEQLVEVEKVKSKVDEIGDELDRMDGKTFTVYINQLLSEGKMHGGMIGAIAMANGGAVAVRNMLRGGHFPGFGGGDRRHVVAEDGEYMLDKFRVRDAGLDTVRAFHRGDYSYVVAALQERIGAIRRQYGGIIDSVVAPVRQYMAAGGEVADSSGGVTNITFSFPSGSTYGPFSGDRAEVRRMQRAEKHMKMGRSG